MRPALVYDSGCGPCTRFRNVVGFLDAGGRMDYLGLEEAEKRGMLDSLPTRLRHASFHLVYEDRIVSGSQAFPDLLSMLPGGRVPAFAMRRNQFVNSLGSYVYTVFSRLHDSGSCTYRPSSAVHHRDLERGEAKKSLGILGQQSALSN